MRRRAVPKCIQHAAESFLDFLGTVPGDLEGAQHDVGPMVSNRAARQLDAVADDVVLVRFDRQRILRVERVEPALRHRKRIVAEGHLPGLRIALVERKIGNPAELVGVRLDDVELAPKVAAKPIDGTADLAGLLRHEENRVARLGARCCGQLGSFVVGQKLRNRALGLLREHQIRDAREAQRLPDLDRLVEETARFLGRAWCNNCAHDIAGGNRLREHRKAGVAKDLGHIDRANRIAQVGLVAAERGHRLVVRDPRKRRCA